MRRTTLGILVLFLLASGLAVPDLQAQCTSITCPANVTVSNDPNQCGAVVTYPAPTPNGSCGTITASPASGSFFPKGTTTVTATSSAGPSCTFTVTVNDTQPPTVTCPANITQSNDPNQCGAVVTYPAATASDNCPGLTVVASPASGSFFPVGTTTVTQTATDAAGNTASCSLTVTINDTQPPSNNAQANITQSNDPNQCGAVVTYTATATDNCPGVTVVASPASGSFFPVGTITVTKTATDPAGNTATSTFTVTVNDTQPPAIICPANQSATATSPSGAVVTYPAPTVTDNCPGVTAPVCAPASGSTFPLGATQVQCSTSDAAGNTATCSFTVTVTPPLVPTLSPWMLALLGLAIAAIGTIAMKLR